jgi:PhzF family phenazine biosynthesis protein
MTTDFVLCDVSGERPHTGNELAVFRDGGETSAESTHLLAREFGSIFEDRVPLAAAVSLSQDDLVDGLPAQAVSTGITHFMVPLRTRDALRRAIMDAGEFPAVPRTVGAQWVYLFTTNASEGFAARARFLGDGMDDSVAGSAAGPLGAYMVRDGLVGPGPVAIERAIDVGRPSRPSVHVSVTDGAIDPVEVTGDLHVWGRGTLLGR